MKKSMEWLLLLIPALVVANYFFPSLLIQRPERPVVSQQLLDDRESRLVEQRLPEIKPEWLRDIQARAQPIRSLHSDSFADLTFLREHLKDKRAVLLGESAHGIAEFNWVKVRLVKYLHQELGFDVIAFESPMTECDEANAHVVKYSAVSTMKDCVFPVWRTEEVLPLFEYIKTSRSSQRPLQLVGFDNQITSRGRDTTDARFDSLLRQVDPAMADGLEAAERQLTRKRNADVEAEVTAFYLRVHQVLTQHRERLASGHKRPVEVDLAIREALSRVEYVRQRAAEARGDDKGAADIRDKAMAENLDFVLDRLYPGRKVIVWAANGHISYTQSSVTVPRPMGSWLEKRRPELYAVGMYMGQGVGSSNQRQLYRIKLSKDDELASVMANAGYRFSFVDLAAAKPDPMNWMHSSITAREWGVVPLAITPAKAYDGLLYIHEVGPPKYVE